MRDYKQQIENLRSEALYQKISRSNFILAAELYDAAESIKNLLKFREAFEDIITSLTCITHGKQQYFMRDNGTWYSRISGRDLTMDEMMKEYLDEMNHYLD